MVVPDPSATIMRGGTLGSNVRVVGTRIIRAACCMHVALMRTICLMYIGKAYLFLKTILERLEGGRLERRR